MIRGIVNKEAYSIFYFRNVHKENYTGKWKTTTLTRALVSAVGAVIGSD